MDVKSKIVLDKIINKFDSWKQQMDSSPKGVMMPYEGDMDFTLYDLQKEGINEFDIEGIFMLMKRANIIRSFERRSTPVQLYHVEISSNLHTHPTIKFLRDTKLFYTQKDGFFLDRITKKPAYSIDGKRKQIILTLLERGRLSGKKLKAEVGYIGKNSDSILSREISTINENFKNALLLVNDLIDHRPAKGYEINSKYKVERIT